MRTAAPTAGFRFSRHCCNSPGCCHRGGLFPGCAAVGGGPPLPWTFAGGLSTCCISRLPPKWFPGVQQCVELACDTPHILFGAMQTFLQSLYRRCWSTEQRPGRRFGGAGAPSGSALSRPAPALGRLAGPGAPKFAEQDRYAATRSYVRQAPRGLRACAPRAVCVSRACRHSPSAS